MCVLRCIIYYVRIYYTQIIICDLVLHERMICVYIQVLHDARAYKFLCAPKFKSIFVIHIYIYFFVYGTHKFMYTYHYAYIL